MDRFSNINTLLAFVTVAREGSVSAAAEVLNLTQPAVSHQLRRLAEDVGITLFHRTATGLQITADGTAILSKAEQVLRAMEEFRRSARQRSGQVRGKLRIGTIVDPEFIRLGPLLSRLRSAYPDIETELSHGVSGEVLNRLRRGQIDLGYYLSSPEDALLQSGGEDPVHCVQLAQFSYRVIAPVGWQGLVERADWAQLVSLPWIGTPEVSVHHRLLQGVFAALGGRQNVVAQVDQEASMLEMVRAGVGLSLCRESIALHQRQSYGLAVADRVSVPACLSCATLTPALERPAVAALFELLHSTWQEG